MLTLPNFVFSAAKLPSLTAEPKFLHLSLTQVN